MTLRCLASVNVEDYIVLGDRIRNPTASVISDVPLQFTLELEEE